MKAPFSLKPLPYGFHDLEPMISQKIVDHHYNGHHGTYIKNLNALVKDTPYEAMTLQKIIKHSWKHLHEEKDRKIFNNAAQVFNHDFYWMSMKPAKMPEINWESHPLHGAIVHEFGNMEDFEKAFAAKAMEQFGSGWVWLCKGGDKESSFNLSIEKTSNAEVPFLCGKKVPLLVCDVWEHAYYLDYQQHRGSYVGHWLKSLANWEFACNNYEAHDLWRD